MGLGIGSFYSTRPTAPFTFVVTKEFKVGIVGLEALLENWHCCVEVPSLECSGFRGVKVWRVQDLKVQGLEMQGWDTSRLDKGVQVGSKVGLKSEG